jgi:hypothetical protein
MKTQTLIQAMFPKHLLPQIFKGLPVLQCVLGNFLKNRYETENNTVLRNAQWSRRCHYHFLSHNTSNAATLPNTANIQSQLQSFFGSNCFLTFSCSTLNHTNCKFLWDKGKVFPCQCHEVIYGTVQVHLHSFLTLCHLMSYRTANLQILHFKYLLNKCPYWIF